MAIINSLKTTAFWATGLLAPLVVKTVEGAVSCFRAPMQQSPNQASVSSAVEMSYVMWCDPLALANNVINNITSALAAKCGAFNILTAEDYNDFDSASKRACDFDRNLGAITFGVNASGTYAWDGVCSMIYGASYSLLNHTRPSPCVMDLTQQTLLLNHAQFPNGTMAISEQYYNYSVPTPMPLPPIPERNDNAPLYMAAGLVAGLAAGMTLFARRRRAEHLVEVEVAKPAKIMA